MEDFGRIDFQGHVKSVIRNKFGFDPKNEQVQAIQSLLFDEEDVILIAKTGFGKSIIFQAAPLMLESMKMALIVMPIKALEDQQCKKLKSIQDCNPFVLNGENNNKSNLSLIRSNTFTHKIAISKNFNDEVLKHHEFARNLCLLALDEIHLVSEWKNFRPEYYNLGVLRARLPDGIPFLGASATLDAKTLATIQDRCNFDEDTNIIKTGLDRPEIFIQINCLQHPINGMLDLQFLLPLQINKPQDIPKTIVFMDSIASIKTALSLMKNWMKQLNYPMNVSKLVSPFFSDMAIKDKERIGAAFEILSESCVGPRILIATDAYGLGIDNPDVKRVVQWLLPSSMANLYQRLGRAMRCGKESANFVLLHPSWCIGPKSEPLENDESEFHKATESHTSKTEPKGKKNDDDKRRDLPSGLWEFINVAPDQCAREIGLNYFDDDSHKTSDVNKSYSCCFICNPDDQISINAHEELNKTQERDSSKRPWYLLKLREWRIDKARELFFNSHLQFVPSLIMPDQVLESLATWAERISDETTMRLWTENAWSDMQHHWPDILEILKRGQKMELSRGEMFKVWNHENDVKRKRIILPVVNPAQVDFDKRRDEWLKKRETSLNKKKNKRKPKGKKLDIKNQSFDVNVNSTVNSQPAIDDPVEDVVVSKTSRALRTRKEKKKKFQTRSVNIVLVDKQPIWQFF